MTSLTVVNRVTTVTTVTKAKIRNILAMHCNVAADALDLLRFTFALSLVEGEVLELGRFESGF